ncbi:cell elongation-specific peptidoglycan D,D-transpeptidase [Knoellia remsis]|uniref:Cell elongation-specific peptidoglycan D,D-transpeptidase n=1 Tax=Knoellia remsis TaxID=407159 RepID=A0A2T0U3K4_9MICO|nr:penicillin-binding protein 2 [Knoellia remsis]PRY52481.1 cell elongation-specific peptidoglycan D,D-transpeptidase [Knoellia remsis]
MNAPIRRLSFVVALLFLSLLVSTTLIQFVYAKELNARPDNRRTLLSTYARERGQILVGDTAVAKSVPTDDQYEWLRTYPLGAKYAHITGYYSFYGAGGGLESAQNSLLSGSSDKLAFRRVSDLFTGRKTRGASLELTINPAVQEAAIKALDGRKGAAVALNPSTGEILAMVSNPSYDPNALSGHDLKKVDAAYKQLTSDAADKPLVNRTIGGDLYPPGSTFKIVTAAAALSTGRWSPESELPGPAVLDLPLTTKGLPNIGRRPCGPNDTTTFQNAFEISCNSAFGYLGMEMGADAFREQAAKFAVGDQLYVPMRVTPSKVPAELNKPQLAQSAVGQYDVRVTPLQVAMLSAGVANRGTVMKPYLVKSVLTSDLSILERTDPEELSQAVTPEVAAQLTTMMQGVVENGSGKPARIDGVSVAGKTGTADTNNVDRAHAWFTGFAPANDPQIAVAVVVENGGYADSEERGGGAVGGPIAKAMLEAGLKK